MQSSLTEWMNITQRQYDYMDGVVFFGSMIKQRLYIQYIPPHHLSCKYSLAKEIRFICIFPILFKIWILKFLELKNKLWTKIFSAPTARSFLQVRCLASHHDSPSQQTCGTWVGSSVPHWDTNIRSLCHWRGRGTGGQYLQYPHRYCSHSSHWKPRNSGQTETDDGCEMKKNVK